MEKAWKEDREADKPKSLAVFNAELHEAVARFGSKLTIEQVMLREGLALQVASGEVLTEQFPEDWGSWTMDETDAFMLSHATERYEYSEADELWEAITNLADTLVGFSETIINLEGR